MHWACGMSYVAKSGRCLRAVFYFSSISVAFPLALYIQQLHTKSCSVYNSWASFFGLIENRNKEKIGSYIGKQKFKNILLALLSLSLSRTWNHPEPAQFLPSWWTTLDHFHFSFVPSSESIRLKEHWTVDFVEALIYLLQN